MFQLLHVPFKHRLEVGGIRTEYITNMEFQLDLVSMTVRTTVPSVTLKRVFSAWFDKSEVAIWYSLKIRRGRCIIFTEAMRRIHKASVV